MVLGSAGPTELAALGRRHTAEPQPLALDTTPGETPVSTFSSIRVSTVFPPALEAISPAFCFLVPGELDWAMGFPDIWLSILLGVSLPVFLGF